MNFEFFFKVLNPEHFFHFMGLEENQERCCESNWVMSFFFSFPDLMCCWGRYERSGRCRGVDNTLCSEGRWLVRSAIAVCIVSHLLLHRDSASSLPRECTWHLNIPGYRASSLWQYRPSYHCCKYTLYECIKFQQPSQWFLL